MIVLEHVLEQTSVQVEESKGELTKENSVCIRSESESYLRKESEESHLNDSSQETQTNDNMEEKELDLTQILERFEDTDIAFYSVLFGETLVREANSDSIDIAPVGNPTERVTLWRNGNYGKYGQCVLYPSREAYIKYPLDPKKAWREWQEEQKLKHKRDWWRAEYEGQYWYIGKGYTICSECDYEWDNANMRYDMGNYFRTKELAQQAAEAVRECLMKFHPEKNKE